MQFKFDFFDIDMQNVSRIIYPKSLKYKKCLREKYICNNLTFLKLIKF